MTPTRDCYILVYVDDPLFLGEQQVVDKLRGQHLGGEQHAELQPSTSRNIIIEDTNS